MHLWGAIEWYRRGTTSVYSCGDTYESLDWHEDNKLPKPSLADLEIAWHEKTSDYERKEYQRKRQAEYLDIEAQLDIMYNQGFNEWLKYIHSIKQKYPSPHETKKPDFTNPLDPINNRMTQIETKVDADLVRAKQDLADLQAAIIDTKGAIYAIKGFMMEIPNIQKQLAAIQEQLGKSE